MLRCAICDYTQEEGSDFAGLLPSKMRVKHSDHYGEFLCDECLAEIDENLGEISDDDDLDE